MPIRLPALQNNAVDVERIIFLFASLFTVQVCLCVRVGCKHKWNHIERSFSFTRFTYLFNFGYLFFVELHEYLLIERELANVRVALRY